MNSIGIIILIAVCAIITTAFLIYKFRDEQVYDHDNATVFSVACIYIVAMAMIAVFICVKRDKVNDEQDGGSDTQLSASPFSTGDDSNSQEANDYGAPTAPDTTNYLYYKVMDNGNLLEGHYELTMEFDNNGDMQPTRAEDVRRFMRAIHGKPNTRYHVVVDVKLTDEAYRAKWMKSNEQAKFKKK
jgi:hypothetical protein